MPNVRSPPSTITEIALIQFPLVVLKGLSNCRDHAVGPKGKYPEMNWRAADKVAAWKTFKRHMNVIFVADQIPEERQWALILVAGGDEAYNCWDNLEDMVEDCQEGRSGMECFREKLQTINFILAFKRRLPGRLQTTRIGDNGLIWISASSRLSGGANGRRRPKRSK